MSGQRIRERICPGCGGPSPGGGTCDRCRAGKTPWFSCDKRVASTSCPACGATKSAGVWTDIRGERAEYAEEVVRSGVRFHPDVRSPAVSFSIRDISQNRSAAEADLSGVLYGEPVTGHCRIEILWQKEQCDRCNRLSGDYHEGVIQVRADERRPHPWEVSRSVQAAYDVEHDMQSGGERLSFVSKVDEHRDGVDITVGSQQIGQAIVQEIVRRLGGRVTTHPKLVGEKAGKRLYRITWSLRLPKLVRGDIFAHGGRYGEVVQPEGKTIRYRDLATGALRSVSAGADLRLVGNAREAVTCTAAYRDGDVIGLIEPGTGRTEEVIDPPWRAISEGDPVRVIRDGDRVVVVG